MKKYNTVMFDLDGTLIDSGEGITNSVMYSLAKFNITVSDRSELYKFIGPPLQYSFETFFGFSEEKAQQAVKYYREYYREKGVFQNTVYDGVEELLKTLNSCGKSIVLATSKPEEFAKKILENLGFAEYFKCIAGADLGGARAEKKEVMLYAVECCGNPDRSEIVMIGDRRFDIAASDELGIDSIGVLYGYGTYDELKNAGAVYIVEKAEDIAELICGSL